MISLSDINKYQYDVNAGLPKTTLLSHLLFSFFLSHLLSHHADVTLFCIKFMYYVSIFNHTVIEMTIILYVFNFESANFLRLSINCLAIV